MYIGGKIIKFSSFSKADKLVNIVISTTQLKL